MAQTPQSLQSFTPISGSIDSSWFDSQNSIIPPTPSSLGNDISLQSPTETNISFPKNSSLRNDEIILPTKSLEANVPSIKRSRSCFEKSDSNQSERSITDGAVLSASTVQLKKKTTFISTVTNDESFQSPIKRNQLYALPDFPIMIQNEQKPSGRRSPVKKMQNEREILLLDYEDTQFVKMSDHNNFTESILLDQWFTVNSPICQALMDYSRETKYANEQIVSRMEKLYSVISNFSHIDYFPSDDHTNYSADKQDMTATFKVSVPATHMSLVAEYPSQSFCNLMIQKIFNPENGTFYTRLLQTIGVDISTEDGSTFKHPANPLPKTIQVIKLPDNLEEYSAKSYESFHKQYILQNSSSCGVETERIRDSNPPFSSRK